MWASKQFAIRNPCRRIARVCLLFLKLSTVASFIFVDFNKRSPLNVPYFVAHSSISRKAVTWTRLNRLKLLAGKLEPIYESVQKWACFSVTCLVIIQYFDHLPNSPFSVLQNEVTVVVLQCDLGLCGLVQCVIGETKLGPIAHHWT